MNQTSLKYHLKKSAEEAFQELIEKEPEKELFSDPIQGIALTILISKAQQMTIEKIFNKLKEGYLV